MPQFPSQNLNPYFKNMVKTLTYSLLNTKKFNKHLLNKLICLLFPEA